MKKDVFNYEGLYEIASNGEVYSLDRIVKRNGQLMKVKGRKLKKYRAKNGYYVVNLHNQGVKQRYVHHLVAEAFLPTDKKHETINHKDGNKLNNQFRNLEYCSYSANNEHARKTRLNNVKIEDYTQRKKVAMLDEDGRITMVFESALEAQRQLGIHHIGCVCKGSRKTAGGVKWKFYETDK